MPTFPRIAALAVALGVDGCDPSSDGAPAASAVGCVRVSSAPDGGDADGESKHPSISADGRFVAFQTVATNLADGGGRLAVLVHDRDADGDGVLDEPGGTATVVVGVARDGGPAQGGCSDPSISGDGRHVAFQSGAENLVGGESNERWDVFVRDRDVDGDGVLDEPDGSTTVCVSVGPDGVAADSGSFLPKISADGRHVVFQSHATNLVEGDENGFMDVFVHDRDPDGDGVLDRPRGRTVMISVARTGRPASGSSANPSISADGRWVAFESGAPDLVEGDRNGLLDVFLADRDADGDGVLDEGPPVIVRPGTARGDPDGPSRRPDVSSDGRWIVFESDATNLLAGDTNGVRDVLLVERRPEGDRLTSLSRAADGAQGDGQSLYPRVSGDGRRVLFVSRASNLAPRDRNGTFDAFLWERGADGPRLVSRGRRGAGDALTGNGEISLDGRWVAFASDASDLALDAAARDANRRRDIWVSACDPPPPSPEGER